MPHCDVRDWVDVFHVQRTVAGFARDVGFSRLESNELAIVGSELTSNILKYGVVGAVDVEPYVDTRGGGLTLIATDRGPPFHNLDAALQDGCDDRGPIDPLQMLTRRGIGGGLGAVLRLSHSFRVEPHPGGKRVHVIRYLSSVKPTRGSP